MSESGTQESYQVLARKYRPQTFDDMIGQEALVTTLTNAFKVGRVAHAFMLTGVRGIGKTTTARLLARALNYERDGVDGPSVDLATPGEHCASIMASTHMDVLEMDAASRTGVENMREMLDGVRYAPVSARYKVYIIDEVHMLSTGAFNALLKTLEEPPDHAKFIFATTEIRKVPITVLSRCQRFDLRRVDADVLATHLSGIAAKEGANISDDGLALIARAAEGSVRDSLSLLDQAIVQQAVSGGQVSGDDVRNMLGLADRVRVLDLFSHAALGDGKSALVEMRSQYDDGADPAIVMRDLLDICHDVTRAKTLGDDASFDVASDSVARMKALSERLSTGQLTRIWQLLLKAHNDVRMAPVPLAAAEMALLALSVAGQLPPPEMAAELIAALRDGSIAAPNSEGGSSASSPLSSTSSSASSPASSGSPTQSSAPISSPSPTAVLSSGAVMSLNTNREPDVDHTAQPNPALTPPKLAIRLVQSFASFADFVETLAKTDIALASDIKRHVRPINFDPHSFDFQPTDDAPPSLTGRMKDALVDLSGANWTVTPLPSGGGETLKESALREKSEQEARDRDHPAFNHPLLRGAKLIEIRETAPTSSIGGDVIAADFSPDEDT
ncbi:DNA polymerase III subunit gamma/tau [Fretibacter rubidus]|uniref:DNA polymerase III subunit gamma/tau n=1 Tax=Fretibacter rubidus TaxID=570162 RepID=UPI00352B3058